MHREVHADHAQDGWQHSGSGQLILSSRRTPKDLIKEKITLHRQTPHLGCTKMMLQLLLKGTINKSAWDAAKTSLLLSFPSVPRINLHYMRARVQGQGMPAPPRQIPASPAEQGMGQKSAHRGRHAPAASPLRWHHTHQ